MTPKDSVATLKFASMVAAKQGWAVNPDSSFVDLLVDGLTVNWNRYGYYLCPCRDSDGSRAADADLICPCAYSRADIAEYGHCFCSLYLSTEFAGSGKAPQSIPERRTRG
jgi:ferredoxin-thioredoxin reductase catalytic chain